MNEPTETMDRDIGWPYSTEQRPPSAAPMPVMSVDEAAERDVSVRSFMHRCMAAGTDYDTGETFGGSTPSLLQPGAQKLQWYFGLSVETTVIRAEEDWDGSKHDGEPIFAYWTEARIYSGGILIAVGHGLCSTRESSRRWRWVGEADLPLGTDPTMFKTRRAELTEFDFAIRARRSDGKYGKPAEYWDNWENATKDGRARPTQRKTSTGMADAWILDGTLYRVPNENVADEANSVLKVAIKRAYVDGIIRATGTSSLFTQDGEDADDNARASSGSAPAAQPVAAPTKKDRAQMEGRASRTAPTGMVNKETGEIIDLPSNVADAMAYPLSPAIWSASRLAVTKTRQVWTTLGDCDIETLEAFAAIETKGDKGREEMVSCVQSVLGWRMQQAGSVAATKEESPA